jgi:hypothetical protein
MEDDIVVEALLREVDEVLSGLRCALVEEVDFDVADLGGDSGVATLTWVMTTGSVGSWASAAAAIASTVSMPLVTEPMIW